MPVNRTLIQIHGFLSSSHIARASDLASCATCKDLGVRILTPDLPEKPKEAVVTVEKLIDLELADGAEVALVGHSLGGYFAAHLARKYHLKAVLVNPVIRGYEIMCEFFGECLNPHTNARFSIGEEDIEYLIGINFDAVGDGAQFLLCQQLGDEITNPAETIEFYRQCRSIIDEGGSHDYEDFRRVADATIAFLFSSFFVLPYRAYDGTT